jgi:hypothetical protein
MKLIEQDNYEIAFMEAAEILKNADLFEISMRTGSEIINDNGKTKIMVKFLLDKMIITFPDISMYYIDTKEEVSMWLKILTLHYLVNSKGSAPTGTEITFKELKGGMSYFSAFQKRAIEPIKKVFGDDLSGFIKAGESLGGIRNNYGDFSLTFQPFPRIKLTYVFWEGDEEFPMEGNIIFDSSIKEYMSTEDIAVLCNMISVMTIKKKI